MKQNLPKVAIVGRANVGKSTLFNRLISENKALVSPIAGTTRDRNIGIAKWSGLEFELIDTGGLDIEKKDTGIIERSIIHQAEKAITTADLIMFVIDIKRGITPDDKKLALSLIQKGFRDKILLVANKADTQRMRQADDLVYKLNLGEPQMVSAANGSGSGDLLDMIHSRLPSKKLNKKKVESPNKAVRVAIVGRPNAGKSSLLNAILGEERVIVTDIEHTTRESHDEEFEYKGFDFTLIDTAGIRKKSKIERGTLEKKSVDRSLASISRADVVVLMTDVIRGVDNQDKKITQEILENSKSVIIVANKWDLVEEKDSNTIKRYENYYKSEFPYLWWAPLVFISAKEGQRAKKILDMVIDIQKSREREITDKELEHFLHAKIKKHRPSRGSGLKNPFIYNIKQSGTNPPRFDIFVNDPKILHFSYIRFLQNNLREEFKIIGTPIQIELKKRPRKVI